jgi:hypothetical protein
MAVCLIVVVVVRHAMLCMQTSLVVRLNPCLDALV